ncbi:MBL fold metallo-hydrolase [Phytohalomonas tamaricis]|uniref:MBL fold metallo-hydrolase n=1 Tax=Phytohalomonas tamaricis TaxID=2081032 RepID=UPI000D0B1384|nr:MBL fold metallo-hydrolase [Phytohalomonas tamaricis]
MHAHMCETCGIQFAPSEKPPAYCPICEDERQYVGWSGQRWTTLDAMRHKGYSNVFKAFDDELRLSSLECTPSFGIGQRALIVQTDVGNLMWECVPYLAGQPTMDKQFKRELDALGGIDAIAISHPHFYSTMIEWAQVLNVPIYLHEDDAGWLIRRDDHVVLWTDEQHDLFGGLTLHRLGGHFKGSQVLHWAEGAQGRGALFTGDTIQVAQDRDWVSFLYSYPNLIPLPASKVADMNAQVQRLEFDRIYGSWTDRNVIGDARTKVARSAQRYIAALEGHFSADEPNDDDGTGGNLTA